MNEGKIMFSVIAVCLILLPAAALWAIPKTRRAGGDFVIAWKCVPPGCGAMLLIPSAVWLLAEYCGIPYRVLRSDAVVFGLFVLGLAGGSAVLVKLRNHCRKQHPSEQARSNAPVVTVFIIMLLVFPVVLAVSAAASFSFALNNRGNCHGPWRTYEIVREHGTELAFQERPIHPFLAEYDYRFRFRRNGTETYQDLWVNTGGRTYFNVFRLKDGRLLFSDKDQDYLTDVKERKVYVLTTIDGVRYAGLLPEGKFTSFGFSQGLESGKVQLHIGDRFADAERVEDELAEPMYIGCITTGFFPASEKPYQPVKKRFSEPLQKPGRNRTK